ncbi:hypothetical protein RB653_006496 [Dictyostelium firmibasis]|uniref:DNA polymerase alpha subunit B n=1 Tax=Dictyostelium firmibasis TaxID=79012 RepID=A0AAN7UDH4_9MYCE
MDSNLYVSRENFGSFNEEELLIVQKIIEELGLTELIVSKEWIAFALSKKVAGDFLKHLGPFKTFLKKNLKKIKTQKSTQQIKEAVEEDPKIFENVEIEDIIFDTDSLVDESEIPKVKDEPSNEVTRNTKKINNNNPTLPNKSIFKPTKQEATNNESKKVVITDNIGDFDFSTVNEPIKQTNPTQLLNYKERKNIGAMAYSLNYNDENKTDPSMREKKSCDLKGAGEEFYPIKYHSDTLEQRTKILKESVHSNNYTFPVPLECDDESMVRSVGRVWMYDQETMLSKRFYLLGNERDSSSGSGNSSTSIFSLETNIDDFSMFSGQVVMAESKKIAGSHFYYTNKLYYPNPLPFFSPRKECGDINVMVASGPFDLQKSIPDYTPLDDLCNAVSNKKPHILLLMGPFIDDSNLHISKYSETYNELFNILMKKLNDNIPLSTKVLIVPSLKDVDHDYILPQPPYIPTVNLNSNILFVPNPFTLIINESFTIGITSSEIYNNLLSKAHSKNKNTPEDIFNMIINQNNYYPMHPAQAPIGMRYLQHLNFPGFTPDILIVSKSSPIAAISNDVLCLGIPPIVGNKSAFGSYADLTITKSKQSIAFDKNIPVSKRTIVNFKNI